MADRSFVFDGSPAWSAEHALGVLGSNGALDEVKGTLATLEASSAPVPRAWLGDRLTLLWTMFMASRSYVDEDALTVWTAEYMRLLGDLPHDIVAHAIDQSVRAARHGFIPSVGEVLAVAEPMLVARRQLIERLHSVHELDSSEAERV